ncbi:MAG: hypothetical protein ACI97N_000325 [Cognaticolwellia sp.]
MSDFYKKSIHMKNIFFLLLFTLTVLITSCAEDEPQIVDLPKVTVENATVLESDNDQTVGITLTLDKASDGNIVFNYSTIGGTAASGIDFDGVSSESFTINAGSTTATLEVVISGDNVEENDETFEIAFLNPIGATFNQSRITVTISDDDVDGGVVIPTSGFTSPLTYPGYTLVWQDEFDGSSLSSDWTQEIGTGNSGWGNNELQYYRTENTTVNGGNLIIEAKQESFGGGTYTSSRIITKGDISFKYGRVDIRAVMPEGQGLWPALWMLGENIDQVSWPACGEIDIMEIVGHQPNKVHGTIHWDANGHANYGGSKTSTSDLSEEFHVFSIIWDANEIKWLLDGVQYHNVDIAPADLDEFREAFFFIFNVAVGGNWPGNPDATTSFPQRMIVDYMRVFQ